MCAIYRTPQVGEFIKTLICRISLEAKIFFSSFPELFVNYRSCPDRLIRKQAIFFDQIPTIARHLFRASLRRSEVHHRKRIFSKEFYLWLLKKNRSMFRNSKPFGKAFTLLKAGCRVSANYEFLLFTYFVAKSRLRKLFALRRYVGV